MTRHGNRRTYGLGVLAAAIVALAAAPHVGDAATDGVVAWTTRFEFAGVVDGEPRATTPVTIGVAPTATDDFDKGADLLAPPLPPGVRYAEACLHRPAASAFFRRLNRDMRGPGAADGAGDGAAEGAVIRWEIVVVNWTSSEWTMAWDASTIPAEWRHARLTCDHLPDIDMRSVASAVIPADGTTVFGVTVGRVAPQMPPPANREEVMLVTAPGADPVAPPPSAMPAEDAEEAPDDAEEATDPLPVVEDVTDIAAPTVEETPADVDGDGVVGLEDLMLVARALGESGDAATDVDRDGRVTVRDLILVALAMQQMAAAPARGQRDAAVNRLLAGDISPEEFARRIASPPTAQRTRLLPNYPNPFNPETWVPFDLDQPSDVSVTVYDTRGSVVRRLALGYREPGRYRAPGRAAHWDGRTDTGEAAVSGAYVVVLNAGGESHRRRIILVK